MVGYNLVERCCTGSQELSLWAGEALVSLDKPVSMETVTESIKQWQVALLERALKMQDEMMVTFTGTAAQSQTIIGERAKVLLEETRYGAHLSELSHSHQNAFSARSPE